MLFDYYHNSPHIPIQGAGGQNLRRNSSGYYSNTSDSTNTSSISSSASISSRKSTCSSSAFNVYKLPEFAHVKSKVDTGKVAWEANFFPISSYFQNFMFLKRDKYVLLLFHSWISTINIWWKKCYLFLIFFFVQVLE